MSLVTSLIMRQMRAPIIILILGYAISILGMVLTPGIDDQGNPWRMSFFDAFYFVSYTATTIGFGEIPYPLTNAQRAWALITIYLTVIAWFYSIGKIISLVQDPTFREALTKNQFSYQLSRIPDTFILICGFGETGHALASALTERNIHVVVIEKNNRLIQMLPLEDFPLVVPGITGDARDPEQLIQAGLQHEKCAAVIAVTASDEINLKIAITSKLLHPDICVICRSELEDFEDNMFSFGTDFVINPFDTFANIFAMAIHSPSLHLLYDWLTGVPDTDLTNPIYVREGHWIICGFGRFGEGLYKQLLRSKVRVTVIDPSEEKREDFLSKPENKNNDFIIGTGFDAHTLTVSGIVDAVGLISGTNNDSNNLSIIMTAREINPDLFIVARQNKKANEKLFDAIYADILMQPSEIIARKIRTLLVAPLMIAFLNKARNQDPSWANITISRIMGALGESLPSIWTLHVNEKEAKALCQVLRLGRVIHVGNLLQNPRQREVQLNATPLMLKRKQKLLLMPTNDIAIKSGDQLLFCGTADALRSMKWSQNDLHSLNYIMTYEDTPDAFIWRQIHLFLKRNERRHRPRQHRHRMK
ncbi:Potassium channel protein [hydrothermal vent metagenome]|uniref:Potassium channel protein n=1 Tax=hydrothermal vent metagenome TaxID=652676 RepID=A0A3B0XUM3_9ZZZZ